MTKYTIRPIRTMIKRGWEYTRVKRDDYLENLTRFSKFVRPMLHYGTKTRSLTIGEISRNGYSEIAKILEGKKIKSITFDIDYFNKPLPLKKTDRIIAASVRAIIRHLATYGIQKETQKGFIEYHLGYDNWLRSDFSIEASQGSSVTVSLGVGKHKPLRD